MGSSVGSSVPSCPALSCAVLGLEPALPGRGLGCMTGLEPEALVLTHSSLPLRALPGCPAVWSPGFIQMRPRGHCLWSPLLPAGSKLVLFKFNVLSLGGDKISVTFMPHTRKCFALWRRQCRLWFFGAGLVDLDLLTA